jgi:formamidopyrimidine-DNA glycosylase
MPELPEVETTARGIRPSLCGKRVQRVVVRRRKLRWPIPTRLARVLPGQRIRAVDRRGKYLLFRAETGTMIIHLGMSGHLRVVRTTTPPAQHDRFELQMSGGLCLRLTDPRCFGCVLWTEAGPEEHPLLARLGPEPLGPRFSGHYLFEVSRRRRAPVKNLIMDGRIVVGIGNIYASESLYRSGIHPGRASSRISRQRYERLADSVRHVLTRAIEAGGTTLQDYVSVSGKPGYFNTSLQVYARAGQPCSGCRRPIRKCILGGRATYYCPGCQR